MTEKEVAEMEAKLAREVADIMARLLLVWRPEHIEPITWNGYFDESRLEARIQENVYLSAYDSNGLHLDLSFRRNNQYWGSLLARPNGEIEVDEVLGTIGMQWIPIFRRNCFLCGYSIECSAHEKLEWTRWFVEQIDNDE